MSSLLDKLSLEANKKNPNMIVRGNRVFPKSSKTEECCICLNNDYDYNLIHCHICKVPTHHGCLVEMIRTSPQYHNCPHCRQELSSFGSIGNAILTRRHTESSEHNSVRSERILFNGRVILVSLDTHQEIFRVPSAPRHTDSSFF